MPAVSGENDRIKLVVGLSGESDHDHEPVALVGSLTSPDSARSNDAHSGREPAAPKPSQRRLGFFAVAVVLFASVAGGPYGIEAAVGSAGALPVLVGSVVLMFMWSAPQALVSAELSTTFPSNGGYITWVVEGLGPVLGFINAANGLAAAISNLPLYPVLLASTIQQLAPNISDGALIAIKMGFIAATVVVNLLGITSVSRLATLFTLLVQVPFIAMPIAAAVTGRAFDWSAVTSVQSNWTGQISLFISTLCWNAIGWSAVGNIASEVRNPKRSYPIGAGLATVMVCVNYLYPVALCVAMAPDITAWTTGYFADIGRSLSPAFGIMATIGCAFSALNNFQPQLSTTARALRFAGLYRMLPIPLLHRNLKRFGTPAAAIFLEAAIVAVLCQYGFNVLVTINVLFYNCALALQFVAFLRMRYTRPHLTRPYEVPGGKLGAWTVSLLLFIILGIGVYAAVQTAWWAIVVAAGANVLFLIAGLAWARWGFKAGLIETIDVVEARGLDAGDPANAHAVVEAAAAVAAAAAAGHEGTAAVLAFLDPGGAGGAAAALDASVARSNRSSMVSTSGHAYGDLTDGESDDDGEADDGPTASASSGADVEAGKAGKGSCKAAGSSGRGRSAGRAAATVAGVGASSSLHDPGAPASPASASASMRSNQSIKLPKPPPGATSMAAAAAAAASGPAFAAAVGMSSSAGAGSGSGGIGGFLAGLLGGRPAAPSRAASSTSMTLAGAASAHNHPAHPNCTHIPGAAGAAGGASGGHGSHGHGSSFSSRGAGVISPHQHSSATSPRMSAHPAFSTSAFSGPGSLPGSTYGITIPAPARHGGSGSAIPFDFTESTPFEEPGLVGEDGTSGGGGLVVEPQGSPPAGIALVELDLNTAEQLTLATFGSRHGHEHERQHSRYGHDDYDGSGQYDDYRRGDLEHAAGAAASTALRSAADEDHRGTAAAVTAAVRPVASPAVAAPAPSTAASSGSGSVAATQGTAPAGIAPTTAAGLVGIGPFRPRDSRNIAGQALQPQAQASASWTGPASPTATVTGSTGSATISAATPASAGGSASAAAGASPFSLAAALASSSSSSAASTAAVIAPAGLAAATSVAARSASGGSAAGSASGAAAPAASSPAAATATAAASGSPSSPVAIPMAERHGTIATMTRSPGQAHLRGLLAQADGSGAAGGGGAGVGSLAIGSLAVGSFALGSLPGTMAGGMGGMGGIGLPLSMLAQSMMQQAAPQQPSQQPTAVAALASAASAAAAAGSRSGSTPAAPGSTPASTSASASTLAARSPRPALAVSPIATPPALPSPLVGAAGAAAARQTSASSGADAAAAGYVASGTALSSSNVDVQLSPGAGRRSGGASISGGYSIGGGSTGAGALSAAGARGAPGATAEAEAARGAGASSPPLTSAKAYAAWVAAHGDGDGGAVEGAAALAGSGDASGGSGSGDIASTGAAEATASVGSATGGGAAAQSAVADGAGAGGLSRQSSAGKSDSNSVGDSGSTPAAATAAGSGGAAREGSEASVASAGTAGGAVGGAGSSDSRAPSSSSAAGAGAGGGGIATGKKRPSSARSQGSAVSAVAVKAAASKANADARVRLLAAEDKDDSDGEGIERYMPREDAKK